MQKVFRIFTGLIVVAVLLSIAWTWGALRFAYSNGERAGYVQKFSKKGWFFKTWEGELAMVNVPGAMQERFPFTVRRDDVAEKLKSSLGKRVVIDYDQHKFLPSSAFGETEYFVTDVRAVDEATPQAPMAAPAHL